MFKALIVLTVLAGADIALAQDTAAVAGAITDATVQQVGGLAVTWPLVGKILLIAAAVQGILRGLGEGLTRIAVLTETKTDDKVAAFISEAAWIIGSFLGKFGYGTPAPVIAAKAEALAAKTGAPAGDKPAA